MSGCAGRLIAFDKPELPRIDTNLKASCDNAVLIPKGALGSPQKTTELWIKDRASLANCRFRHDALVRAVGVREDIQGKSQ